MSIKLYFNDLNEKEFPNLSLFNGYLAVFTPTKWDDYGFKSTFNLSLVNYSTTSPTARTIGQVKVGFVGQKPSSSPISGQFYTEYFSRDIEGRLLDKLPNNFFSLPEYDSFYQDIENYFSNDEALITNFYMKIRETLKNNLQTKITTEDFFKSSFQRTFCFLSHEEFLWLYHQTRPMKIFQEQISQANKIVSIKYNGFLNEDVFIMLHGFLIATLENYLSTTFIKTVLGDNELILKQATRDGKVKDTKFKIEELPNWQNTLKEKVKKSLEEMSFHNIEAVMPLFINVLNCTLPENLSWLIDAVKIRHDCAHRAGYDINGKKLNISKDNILELIEKLNEFAKSIEIQVNVNPKY
ncbi:MULTISPECIES: hypothetical protein [unclassified Acinetobacter]|uniref:hypothetical protein n=1 Tax=unclassified Acinetobacter TaxID=196816 RepID=UPI000F71BD0C|nr:hypothetical protein [Acinetobacter sp. 5862]AZM39147.1 hypothetical protein EJP75_11725 [Acinetobacter baumannii]